jgi:hypothetical protein
MKDPNNLFNNAELIKLSDSINSSQTMRLNLATFFGTSHLAFISYAVSQSKLSILVIGSFLLIFFIVADHFILRGIYGYYIRAKRIIKLEGDSGKETLFDMFRLIIVDRRSMKNELLRIIDIQNDEKRFHAIRKLPLKIKSVLGFWVPASFFLIEIGIAATLYLNRIWCFIN